MEELPIDPLEDFFEKSYRNVPGETLYKFPAGLCESIPGVVHKRISKGIPAGIFQETLGLTTKNTVQISG